MTKSTAAVLAEALRLDTPERAELAAELLGSLSGPTDSGAEAEMLADSADVLAEELRDDEELLTIASWRGAILPIQLPS